jgi:hypothetical protein
LILEPRSSDSQLVFIMAGLGKILILVGGVFIVVGFILVLAPRIPFIGKLPGDIHIKRENFEIQFPLATSILLSVVASGILWAISHFGKK